MDSGFPSYVNPLYQYGQPEEYENEEIVQDELMDQLFGQFVDNPEIDEQYIQELESLSNELRETRQENDINVFLERLREEFLESSGLDLDEVDAINIVRNDNGNFELGIFLRPEIDEEQYLEYEPSQNYTDYSEEELSETEY